MTAGRKPKPTALKRLEGNPGRRPLNEAEPEYAAAKARMPHGLSRGAKGLWVKVAGELIGSGVMTGADVPAFMLMAEHWAIARQAAEMIAEQGLQAPDENGALRKHPLLQVLRDNAAAFRLYAAEFGLTPSSRTRVAGNAEPPASLEELLFGEVAVTSEAEDDDGE